MSHTPDPWAVGGHEPNCIFAGEEKTLIAECHSRKSGNYSRDEPEQVANAEHIVRCVNAHEDLLAACRTAKLHLEATGYEDTLAHAAVTHAIAKATP